MRPIGVVEFPTRAEADKAISFVSSVLATKLPSSKSKVKITIKYKYNIIKYNNIIANQNNNNRTE